MFIQSCVDLVNMGFEAIFFDSANKLSVGQYVMVRVDESVDYDLMGEVIDESAE